MFTAELLVEDMAPLPTIFDFITSFRVDVGSTEAQFSTIASAFSIKTYNEDNQVRVCV